MPAFHLLATLSLVSCSISNFCLLLILTGVAVTTTTTTPTKNATPSCNLTSILRREGMERWMDDDRPLHLYYHGKLLILGNIMYDIHYTILKQYLKFMNHSCSKNVKNSVSWTSSWSTSHLLPNPSVLFRPKYPLDSRDLGSYFTADREPYSHPSVEGGDALHFGRGETRQS